jgi:hypothetical protein
LEVREEAGEAGRVGSAGGDLSDGAEALVAEVLGEEEDEVLAGVDTGDQGDRWCGQW